MLPLGLVIPTFNSRRYLQRHVKGLLPWIDLVEEIVVVDSHSNDGSAEFLVEHLPHPNLRVYRHPPGLYASWNYGISQLMTEYFIMSTTGDTITREGVEKLMQCAEEENCDIVLSKPVFVDLKDQAHQIRWPLDDMLEGLKRGESRGFGGLEALVYAMGMPDSALLGSSASNLYRTDFFRKRPFPLDWGVAGDAGWVWLHAVEARWGALAGGYSQFLLHPPQSQDKDRRPAQVQRADLTLQDAVPRWLAAAYIAPQELVAIGWERLLRSLVSYLNLKANLDAARAGLAPWFLRSTAWRQRRLRRDAFASLQRARDRALVEMHRDRGHGGVSRVDDPARSAPALTFLLFHYGGIPRYLHHAIEHLRVFNPEAEIMLVTEGEADLSEIAALGVTHRKTSDFSSPELELFQQRYLHISCFKEKYERFVLERWFMTETLRRQRPDRTYIMQDSDVAVFGDASKLLPLLPDCPIAMSGPNPHFTFIRGTIDEFLQFILDYYADDERLAAARRLFEMRRNTDNIYNLGEMTLLFEFLEKSKSMQMFDTDTPVGYVDTNLHMTEDFDFLRLRRRPRKKVRWQIEGGYLVPYFLKNDQAKRAFLVHFQGPGKRVFYRFNSLDRPPSRALAGWLNLLYQHKAIARWS
jgi:glycosyltransferase involved in cell wall biosynthesis